MFWKIRCEEIEDASEGAGEGRFVLHRHVDALGEHLDLRLECDGHLRGWRIDARELESEQWATEKAPHPVGWLEHDRDAQRVDAGEYAWERSGPDGGELILRGACGCRRVQVSRAIELPVKAARAIADAVRALDVAPDRVAGLIGDGVHARQRAVERLCGLGRELDGDAFDDVVWRKTLAGLSLEDVHGQLRAFEVRFDVKYPPQAVSRGESSDDPEMSRSEEALAIVRG